MAGSPFHPKVVHAGKVRCVDGWQSIIDANNQMQLEVNQIKRIELDCIDAGMIMYLAAVFTPQVEIIAHVLCPAEKSDTKIHGSINQEYCPVL